MLRDLERSGIEFVGHGLTVREERLSTWDLEMLGFCGDIKRSLFFLRADHDRHGHTGATRRIRHPVADSCLVIKIVEEFQSMQDSRGAPMNTHSWLPRRRA